MRIIKKPETGVKVVGMVGKRIIRDSEPAALGINGGWRGSEGELASKNQLGGVRRSCRRGRKGLVSRITEPGYRHGS